uniref:Ubiquitin-like protease family profile domain-containing protein n=1 Tax=Brassica oleracea var. oleracea TaxID=109376 RepID=A0A0D3CSB4_BRAOL
MLGVHVEARPSTQEIIAGFERCEGWMINFVQKDIGQMFPKWEFDVEDKPAENIIELMFVKKPWKWTMDFWEVTDTWVNTKPTVVSPAKKKVVKEDSPRPRKKARKDAPAEASEEAAAEASEDSESVNGTNAGRKSLAEDKGPDVPAAVPADASFSNDKALEPSLVLLDKNQPTVSDLQKEDARYQEKKDAALAHCRAKSDRTRKLTTSQQSPYTANSTVRVIIPNKKLYPDYNPFAPIDKKKLKELVDWLKTYDLPISRLHIDAWINVLRKRYDANPQHFRSERICFLDHLFAQQWIFNFKDFKDSEPDQNGLGRRFPGGAWNYYAGTIPSFCQSNKVWGTDIDNIYAPVNYTDTHWIAM